MYQPQGQELNLEGLSGCYVNASIENMILTLYRFVANKYPFKSFSIISLTKPLRDATSSHELLDYGYSGEGSD